MPLSAFASYAVHKMLVELNRFKETYRNIHPVNHAELQ